MENFYDLPPNSDMEMKDNNDDGNIYNIAAADTARRTSINTNKVSNTATDKRVICLLVFLSVLVLLCTGVLSYFGFIVFQMNKDVNSLLSDYLTNGKNEWRSGNTYNETLNSHLINLKTHISSLNETVNTIFAQIVKLINDTRS
ncbi:uncharacterized protein LOC120335954 [Styela clava]